MSTSKFVLAGLSKNRIKIAAVTKFLSKNNAKYEFCCYKIIPDMNASLPQACDMFSQQSFTGTHCLSGKLIYQRL